jgi:polycystin 1L2
LISEDTNNYELAWSPYTSNINNATYNEFMYQNATVLNGYPIFGDYNSYWGGGYIYEMRGKLKDIIKNLTFLQTNSWIDRQTRAVMIEFSIYNPNVNLFLVAQLVVEFLPIGSILTSSRFDPISIFDFNVFRDVSIVIVIVFIIYFMIHEIKEICMQGIKKHLFKFWSLVEWSLIIFSWCALAMYIYRFYTGNKVLDFIKETQGYGYYKFQIFAFWNECLRYCLAFCSALSTLKFIKILRFNKRVAYLASTLNYAASELISFFIIFFILWCTFVQTMFLTLQKQFYQFSTFTKSLMACFQIILGKDEISADSYFLGSALFIFYNIFVLFILLNMFISIINDAFSAVRERINNNNEVEECNIMSFFFEKFKSALGIKDYSNEKEEVDQIKMEEESFDDKFDKLAGFLNKVNF